jgi:hypothetical protein
LLKIFWRELCKGFLKFAKNFLEYCIKRINDLVALKICVKLNYNLAVLKIDIKAT